MPRNVPVWWTTTTLAPTREVGFVDGRVGEDDAHMIDQDIHRAVPRDGRLNHAVPICRISDVQGLIGGPDVGRDHDRAFRSEQIGGGASDPLSGAGHKRGLSLEPIHDPTCSQSDSLDLFGDTLVQPGASCRINIFY